MKFLDDGEETKQFISIGLQKLSTSAEENDLILSILKKKKIFSVTFMGETTDFTNAVHFQLLFENNMLSILVDQKDIIRKYLATFTGESYIVVKVNVPNTKLVKSLKIRSTEQLSQQMKPNLQTTDVPVIAGMEPDIFIFF